MIKLIQHNDSNDGKNVNELHKNLNIKNANDYIEDVWDEVELSRRNMEWKEMWPHCNDYL